MTNEVGNFLDDQIAQTKLNRNYGQHWWNYYLCENVSWLIRLNSSPLACVAQTRHTMECNLNRAFLETQQKLEQLYLKIAAVAEEQESAQKDG